MTYQGVIPPHPNQAGAFLDPDPHPENETAAPFGEGTAAKQDWEAARFDGKTSTGSKPKTTPISCGFQPIGDVAARLVARALRHQSEADPALAPRLQGVCSNCAWAGRASDPTLTPHPDFWRLCRRAIHFPQATMKNGPCQAEDYRQQTERMAARGGFLVESWFTCHGWRAKGGAE